MTQLISNLLMQPRPTDAVERPLTLVEKLEQLSDEYLNQYMDYGDKADLSCSVAVDDAIAIVKQHSDWVSVDKRLPEHGVYVLGYDPAYHNKICVYTYGSGIWLTYPMLSKSETVTHWCELPKSPSEVQE